MMMGWLRAFVERWAVGVIEVPSIGIKKGLIGVLYLLKLGVGTLGVI